MLPLFFRCKQLQLTTIRAFFDLIDADTKQVCTVKLKACFSKVKAFVSTNRFNSFQNGY